MWADFVGLIGAYHVGDLASVLGVLISLVGFGLTVWGVARSKKAAERAEEAAKSARDSIRLFDLVADFTSAISILEDVKRVHRSGQWNVLPDRYASIRKHLINLRIASPNLSEGQNTVIQEALSNLRVMEESVERAIPNGGPANPAKLNAALSKDIDRLIAVLGEIKMMQTGR